VLGLSLFTSSNRYGRAVHVDFADHGRIPELVDEARGQEREPETPRATSSVTYEERLPPEDVR
jgi:hypothetical protein